MPKRDVKALDEGQLDFMWNFLRAGFVKPNIPALQKSCDDLRQLMIQKTAGQRKDNLDNYLSYDDLPTVINSIVIEAMALHLSGDLDRLKGDSSNAKAHN